MPDVGSQLADDSPTVDRLWHSFCVIMFIMHVSTLFVNLNHALDICYIIFWIHFTWPCVKHIICFFFWYIIELYVFRFEINVSTLPKQVALFFWTFPNTMYVNYFFWYGNIVKEHYYNLFVAVTNCLVIPKWLSYEEVISQIVSYPLVYCWMSNSNLRGISLRIVSHTDWKFDK